jgi:acyl-CoA thioesterase FadM
MHYFHLAMEEFFRCELGIDYADVLHKHNVSLPTVHLESDFRRRLKYGDRIDMEVRVLNIGQTSITWGYRGYRAGDDGEVVVEGHNVTVCVATDTFEKTSVPDWLRESLTAYQEKLGTQKA